MAVTVTSVTGVLGGFPPGVTVTFTDQASGGVVGTAVADASGNVQAPMQVELYEAGAAAGAGGAQGSLTSQVPGANEAGGAGGTGGGSGSVAVAQPLAGAAGGSAGASAAPGQAKPLAGGAGGQGGGQGAEQSQAPGAVNLGGSAGGSASAGPSQPSQTVALGGLAAGGATAGPSQPAQVKPLAGAGAGQGGASASASSAADTTAPVAGTLTVPSGTAGTAMTTINPGTCTDAVGITGWAILDQAADSGWPATLSALTSAGATWNTITATTSWAPGATLSYTPATAGSPRYFKLHLRDAAGNLTASATASATVAAGGLLTVSDNFNRANGLVSVGQPAWVQILSLPVATVAGNVATDSAGSASGAFWNATFANKQFAQVDIVGGSVQVMVRGGASSYGYRAVFTFTPDDGETGFDSYYVTLTKGANTVIGSTWYAISTSIGVPTKLRLRVDTSGANAALLAEVYYDGAWHTAVSFTEAVAYASGCPGFLVSGGGILDNFSGGEW